MKTTSSSRPVWPDPRAVNHAELRRLLLGSVPTLILAGLMLFVAFNTRAANPTAQWYAVDLVVDHSSPLYVSNPGGVDTGACTNSAAPCATIQYANGRAAPSDTIYVAVGTYTAVTGAQVVNITQTLTLSGGWNSTFITRTGTSTIDAQNVSGRRGMLVLTGVSATVSSFVIRNGNLSITSTTYGGGVYVGGSLTLSNTTVISNTAAIGGGIYNNGTLTVTSSSIYSNTAANGGGIYNDGTLTVTSSSIYSNTAGTYGGGAYNSQYARLIFANSAITGNQANLGSGLYNLGVPPDVGVITLTNTSLSNNTIYNDGGRIVSSGGISADVVNAGGAFRPSSSPTQPGSLTITGTFTQTAAGALEFLLAGLTPATQFDQLNVNGQAVLAGSLNISVTANFTPTLGQSFRIINYTSHTGSFGGVSTLALPASVLRITPRGGTRPLWFLPVYDASGVTLVVATPPLYLPFIRR